MEVQGPPGTDNAGGSGNDLFGDTSGNEGDALSPGRSESEISRTQSGNLTRGRSRSTHRLQGSVVDKGKGLLDISKFKMPPKDAYTRPASRFEKIAYFFDRILARRSGFFLVLACWGVLQVVVWGAIYSFFWTYEGPANGECGDPRTENSVNRFVEGIWEAWTFMADPGTHSKVYLSGQRSIGSMIAVCGILFWSTVMALTVDAIREKMDTLRQGRSKIVERDHTLILGWTEKTMHIVEELCNANESEGGGVIAILAPERKDQMENELALQLPVKSRRGTRVIFRRGSPLVLGDLTKVSVNKARSIIILATASDADQADADTLRTLLSLRSLYQDLDGHVVAEVRDIDNEPLVKLVGGAAIETLVSHDVIGRLMLMSVRQPGLAKVYESLLGFEGDEFYMAEWPMLVGAEFGDLFTYFLEAVPIGICTRDDRICLGPANDTIVNAGDKVIVIAQDNDSYKPEDPIPSDAGEPPEPKNEGGKTEKILFCGWRRDIRDVLQQLEKLVQPGAEVHMMTHSVPLASRNDRLLEDGLDVKELRNVTLLHYFGNTSVRRKLEQLPIEEYSSCMIFADQEFESDSMRSDSHSLATLLYIRDIQVTRGKKLGKVHTSSPNSGTENLIGGRGSGGSGAARMSADSNDPAKLMARSLNDFRGDSCPIVCEILDPHTQKTISRSEQLSLASDFCQTNKFVAQVLSMISEERFVKVLLDELLGSSGCAISVVPSAKYAKKQEVLTFMQVARRAMLCGEVLIGYQVCNSMERTVLNPPNKDKQFLWDSCDFAVIKGDAAEQMPEYLSEAQAIASAFEEMEKREEMKEVHRDKVHDRQSRAMAEYVAEELGLVRTANREPWEMPEAGYTQLCDYQSVDQAAKSCLSVLQRVDQGGFQELCSQMPGPELNQFCRELHVLRAAVCAHQPLGPIAIKRRSMVSTVPVPPPMIDRRAVASDGQSYVADRSRDMVQSTSGPLTSGPSATSGGPSSRATTPTPGDTRRTTQARPHLALVENKPAHEGTLGSEVNNASARGGEDDAVS